MFTGLGQIFSIAPPRRTETTDTRQPIQRHDPDHERHKKKKHETLEKADLFSMHNSAMVSVGALQAFLDNFIKEQKITKTFEQKAHEGEVLEEKAEEGEAQERTSPIHQKTCPSHDQSVIRAGANSYATQAYQNMQNNLDVHRADKISDPKAMPTLGLSAQDIRTIHKLRIDLKVLADQRMEFIKIEQNQNFLNALVEAVDHELKKLDAS